jgi:hypothetical protein
MIAVQQIRAAVDAYLGCHPGDAGQIATLINALADPGDLASRTTFTGHVTCSAIVLDPGGHVLHIRHNALDRWLCPGGHLDLADSSLVGAALREVSEETGIDVRALALVDEMPIDIDVHPIPANPARGEPGHQHFDCVTPSGRLPDPRSACNATKCTTSPGFLLPKSGPPSWPSGSLPLRPASRRERPRPPQS